MSVVAAELIARLSADTAPADRELRGWVGRLGGTGGALSGISSVFAGNLLSGAVQGLGRGLADVGRIGAGVFVDMVSSGADLEAQLDGVYAVLGATDAQAQQLRETALGLALNPDLKVGTDEALGAMYTLATAGMTTDEIIGGVAESVVLLANASGADFPQAAEVMTKAMSIFALEAGDAMGTVDQISGVLNASTFDLNDYAYFMANAGGTAATLGVSLEDLNTAAALLSPSFSTGRDAGTGFKSMLLGLNPATNEARSAMSELGFIMADGTNVFYDQTGALVDLDEIWANLNATMGKLTPQERQAYARAIWGTEGMEAALAMLRIGGEEYARLDQIVGNTSALEQAATRTDNLKSSWETFNESIQAIKTSMGSALEEPLNNMVKAIMPVFDWAAPQLGALAQNLGAWLEQKIPVVEVAVKTAFTISDGNELASALAGLGELTGADVNLDANAKIVDVKWGEFGHTYEAEGNVTTWTVAELGIVRTDGEISSFTWNGQTILDNNSPIVIAAKWVFGSDSGDFFYELGRPFREGVDSAFRDYTVPIGVKIAEVLWGAYTWTYDAIAYVGDVLWGAYTWTYDAIANVSEVLWGSIWETIYDTSARIEGLWGNVWETLYSADATIIPDWGDTWTQIYSAVVDLIPNWLWGGGGSDEPTPQSGRPRAPSDLFGGNRDPNAPDYGGVVGQGYGVTVNNYNTVRRPHDAQLVAQYTAQEVARRSRK